MSSDRIVVPDVNSLIMEKLAVYSDEVRELALQAIQLSESFPEGAVAEQLQSVLRRLAKQKDGQ